MAKRPRDPNQLAKLIVDIATGETVDAVSELKRHPSKRRSGGLKGGKARAKSLTNAFSKKVENHAAMVAIHFMYYNFGRIHKTLRVTPAMQAGLADHVWSLEEIVLLAN
jgi:hypothetical protein